MSGAFRSYVDLDDVARSVAALRLSPDLLHLDMTFDVENETYTQAAAAAIGGYRAKLPLPGRPASQPVAKVPAAFDGCRIPADGVARRLHMPNMRPPRALSAGRAARLGATRGFSPRAVRSVNAKSRNAR